MSLTTSCSSLSWRKRDEKGNNPSPPATSWPPPVASTPRENAAQILLILFRVGVTPALFYPLKFHSISF